jgi:formylglycine-generating enzyme required for sulfatase activity/nitrate/TMAO reductase-like tetraheme cytochrome c subunit
MKRIFYWFIPGLLVGVVLMFLGIRTVDKTSTNDFCISCHIHPAADQSWKKSVHYQTQSGTRVDCVECHLPPKGEGYLKAKVTTGFRDLWSMWTKDSASFNWEEKGRIEFAQHHVYESSCVKCHENLFPSKLSKAGEDAHLYYKQSKEKGETIHCINCHLNAGHYIEGYTHGSNSTFGKTASASKKQFAEATTVKEFKNFTEQIPLSSTSFNMVAIPGGKFKMGSKDDEVFHKEDEGPVVDVEVSPFFMAEIEVSWDEYLTFYAQTAAEGRSSDTEGVRNNSPSKTDAISGATPPYGQPDQGWGLGKRPAISFSYHAAETYCKWLSQVTGKNYRLPTEAEWEYACRAGSTDPYFFAIDTEKFKKKGLKAKLIKEQEELFGTHIVYKANSGSKTQLPSAVSPNAFGLKNMAGNVAEFCSDWYQPDTYSKYPKGGVKDPKGPEQGSEHVIRGGSFMSTPDAVRSSARDYTRTEAWLKTDPQIPKSIWWYSDCFHVGLRVVCNYDEKTGNNLNKLTNE